MHMKHVSGEQNTRNTRNTVFCMCQFRPLPPHWPRRLLSAESAAQAQADSEVDARKSEGQTEAKDMAGQQAGL